MRHICLAVGLVVASSLCKAAEEKVDRPVPSPRQWAWHKREMLAFVHFGVNTFTGKERGTGSENPSIFAPTELDCKQWCRVFKETGFKGVILTAKHHDGFCLWQTTTTTFGVRSSSWRNGKGDVVAELSDACREFGLELGIYLSPADFSKPTGGVGAAYDALYQAQLRELLTKYGPVFEVWIDGGGSKDYNWPAYYKTVRDLAPTACIFSERGPDVRWSGSERGYVGLLNWNTVDLTYLKSGAVIRNMLLFGQKGGPDWMPAECDVSIRHGWFFHDKTTQATKSVDDLMGIYLNTVGHGAVLLLNVPPDRRGLLDETDVARLYDFAADRAALLRTNLIFGSKVMVGGRLAHDGDLLLADGNADTFLPGGSSDLEVMLQSEVEVGAISIGEYLPKGQRVESYEVQALQDGTWRSLIKGSTIGYKAILPVATTTTKCLRIQATTTEGEPLWTEFGIYPPKSGKAIVGEAP